MASGAGGRLLRLLWGRIVLYSRRQFSITILASFSVKNSSLFSNSSLNKSEIRQSKEFSVDDLAVALENAIQSFGAVASKTFRERIQRKIAFATLPDLSQEDKAAIEAEIERNTPDKIELQTQVINRALIKPAPKASQGNQPKDGSMMQDQNGKGQNAGE